jgi:hypothetical protein
LLCASRERPRRRAAEQRYELAPFLIEMQGQASPTRLWNYAPWSPTIGGQRWPVRNIVPHSVADRQCGEFFASAGEERAFLRWSRSRYSRQQLPMSWRDICRREQAGREKTWLRRISRFQL